MSIVNVIPWTEIRLRIAEHKIIYRIIFDWHYWKRPSMTELTLVHLMFEYKYINWLVLAVYLSVVGDGASGQKTKSLDISTLSPRTHSKKGFLSLQISPATVTLSLNPSTFMWLFDYSKPNMPELSP